MMGGVRMGIDPIFFQTLRNGRLDEKGSNGEKKNENKKKSLGWITNSPDEKGVSMSMNVPIFRVPNYCGTNCISLYFSILRSTFARGTGDQSAFKPLPSNGNR